MYVYANEWGLCPPNAHMIHLSAYVHTYVCNVYNIHTFAAVYTYVRTYLRTHSCIRTHRTTFVRTYTFTYVRTLRTYHPHVEADQEVQESEVQVRRG